MKNNIITLFASLLLISCARQPDEPEMVKDIPLDVVRPAAVFVIPNVIESDDNVLVLQSRLDLSDISIVRFDSSGVVGMEKLNFRDDMHGCFMCFKNHDTIIYFPVNCGINSLFFYDDKGVLHDEIDLHPALAGMDPMTGLKLDSHRLYVGNSNEEYGTISAEERALYYENVKPVCVVDLSNRNVSVFGAFPVFYKKNNYSFNDWFPVICPLEDNRCLISFACDDSVYLYKNDVKEKAFLCKSRYIDEFVPFDDSRAFDMGYYRKYSMSNPKYSNLVYNRHTGEYYRVAEHEKEVGVNGNLIDGHVPTWSIIVMDSSFSVKKEYCFQLDEYNPEIIVPSKEGVYLRKAPSIETYVLTLTLFKL
jgi:hypothetical protein